ncbi:MAG: hypothetical protein WCD79_09565 [Chthoniobacteraceae bacterium]
MSEEPPPLPQASRKRILPAFLLCFVLCAHRIYAGKVISGVIQLAWIAGGFYWFKVSAAGVLQIVNSSQFNMDTIERVSNWEETNGIPYLPILMLIAAGIWVAIDAARLVAGKFTDGQGLKITRWI